MLEAILKKLAAIGIHIPTGAHGGVNLKAKGTKIIGIKFSSFFQSLVHVDNSTHNDNRVIVVINHEKCSSKQRHSLQRLIPELLDGAGAIMDVKSVPTVESATESLPGIREIAKKLFRLSRHRTCRY